MEDPCDHCHPHQRHHHHHHHHPDREPECECEIEIDEEWECEIEERHTGTEALINVIASMVGSVGARALCQPLEVARVRLQVYPTLFKSIKDVMKDTYKQKGVAGLWRGHNIAQISGLFQNALQFFLYEQLSYTLEQTFLNSRPNAKNFICGYMTGTIGVFIISPLEMAKSRVISSEKGKPIPLLKVLHKAIRTEGIKGLYKGALAAILHVGPLIGSRFMIYNLLCNTSMDLTDYKTKSELPASILLLAGGGSGVISNALVYPVEVVKRRMHVRGLRGGIASSCTKIKECFSKTIREEGFRGLYRGIRPTLIKSALTTSIMFSSFDKIRAELKRIESKFE